MSGGASGIGSGNKKTGAVHADDLAAAPKKPIQPSGNQRAVSANARANLQYNNKFLLDGGATPAAKLFAEQVNANKVDLKDASVSDRFSMLRKLALADQKTFNDKDWIDGQLPIYEMAAQVLETTPVGDRAKLFKKLILAEDAPYLALIRNMPDEATNRLIEKLGPDIMAALDASKSEVALRRVTHGLDLHGKPAVFPLSNRQKVMFAGQEVSRLWRDASPFNTRGISGVSTRLSDAGDIEVFAHLDVGPPEKIGTVEDAAALLGSDEKGILKVQNEVYRLARKAYLGADLPEGEAPAPWANMALPFLSKDGIDSSHPGAPLLQVKVSGKAGALKFEMPADAFAKLIHSKSTQSEDQQRDVQLRLAALGVPPNKRGVEKNGKNLIVSEENARLLLTSRTFNDAFRAQGGAAFPMDGDTKKDWNNWEFVRYGAAGVPSVVIPDAQVSAFKDFKQEEDETVRQATQRLLFENFGRHNVVISTSVDDVPALAMTPEHAQLLLNHSTYRFPQHAIGLDPDKIRIGARISDTAYMKQPDALYDMARLGITEKQIAFVRENESEAMISLQWDTDPETGKREPYFHVTERGTDSLRDVGTDVAAFGPIAVLGRGLKHVVQNGLSVSKALENTLEDPPRGTYVEYDFDAGSIVGDKTYKLKVHEAFNKEVKNTNPKVVAAMQSLLEANAFDANQFPIKSVPVFNLGHSKGGGMAELRAIELASQGFNVKGGVTVEAARSGDKGLVEFFRESKLSKNWITLQMGSDPVKNLPPWGGGFKSEDPLGDGYGFMHPGIVFSISDMDNRPRLPEEPIDPAMQFIGELASFEKRIRGLDFKAMGKRVDDGTAFGLSHTMGNVRKYLAANAGAPYMPSEEFLARDGEPLPPNGKLFSPVGFLNLARDYDTALALVDAAYQEREFGNGSGSVDALRRYVGQSFRTPDEVRNQPNRFIEGVTETIGGAVGNAVGGKLGERAVEKAVEKIWE